MRNRAPWHKPWWLLCSMTQVDRARRRKEKLQPTTNPSTPVKSRLRSTYPLPKAGDKNENICFFCDEPVYHEKHRASTPKFDRRVRDMVTELRDTRLLAEMYCGDLTALDAVYHKKCLTTLYARHISLSRKNDASTRDDLTPESLALAELNILWAVSSRNLP